MLTENFFGVDDSQEARDMSKINTIVMFHYPCRDGFAAAWVASLFLGTESTYFWPCNYSDLSWGCADARGLPPEMAFEDWSVFDGKRILVADFAFPPPVLRLLAQRAESVTVCDHHLKFRRILAECSDFPANWMVADPNPSPSRDERGPGRVHIYDESGAIVRFHDHRCGAQITYDFLSLISTDNVREKFEQDGLESFLSYIADRDLWLWQEYMSEEFHAFLDTVDETFGAWNNLLADYLSCSSDWLEQGRALLRAKRKTCERLAARYFMVRFSGWEVEIPVVNAGIHQSEVCEMLLDKCPEAPFSASYYDRAPNRRIWSLRSRKGGTDVCSVARERGGGGHKSAAGFQTEVTDLLGEV